MKKIGYFILALVLTGCSSHSSKPVSDTDSVLIEAEEAIDSIDNNLPVLTSEGLGTIKIGMSLDSLPDGIAGLYDIVVRDATPDAETYTCMEGDEVIFTIYDFGSGQVDMISVQSPKIKAGCSTASNPICMGESFRNVLKISGVETEWVSSDDGGQWYWKADGLWMLPTVNRNTQSLSAAMCDSSIPPSAALITDDIRIDYLATGLPY